MKTIPLILLMIFFCSCGRNNQGEKDNSDSVLEIDLLSEPESTVTKLSEIAENVEYIPLETTDSTLIGDLVRKIVNTDNRIYLLNSGLESEILCFNTNGKFYFKINRSGRGPEEYLSLTDFDISDDNTILTILSASDSRIKVYGISEAGFAFQRSVSLKDQVPLRMGMVPGTDRLFLAIPPWAGGNEPTLSILINTHGDTLYLKPNCYKTDENRTTNTFSTSDVKVYSTGNMVCFKEIFSDTVFYVDSKENLFKPRLILNTHGTLFTPEMRSGLEEFRKNTTSINNVFETKRYVFYWYGEAQEIQYNIFIFDKNTNTKYKMDIGIMSKTIMNIPQEIKTIVLKDDITGGPVFNMEFRNSLFCSNDRLFSFVDAMTLKNYIAGEEFKSAVVADPGKKEELRKLADSLKETDNPVLVMVTPKE
jgi:hypothetical protein